MIDLACSNLRAAVSHKKCVTPQVLTEEQVKRLQEGLVQMCDANIALRHQLGAITAIVTTAVLLNERTNRQLKRMDRDK